MACNNSKKEEKQKASDNQRLSYSVNPMVQMSNQLLDDLRLLVA